jgi:TetR/AcrR family transcriptional regulator, lmrAB and yxaGH operons repressor
MIKMPAASLVSSRDRMLHATIELLRGFGLSGAGINDVVRESAAPKGSVYHFFPGGKLQLVGEALAGYAASVEAFIDETLARPRSRPAKVRALFEAFARRVEAADFQRSCAVGTVSLDLDTDAEPLRPLLVETLERWVRAIARHIDLGDARRSRSFAGLVMTAVEGAYVRSRAEHSAGAFREAGGWLAKLVA